MATPISLIIFFFFIHTISALNQDGKLLLKVKNSLSDPAGSLTSWSGRDATPCNWTGVTCHKRTGSVISLDLTEKSLSGPFPVVYLCSLNSISNISIFSNSINGSVPESISTCRNLVYLDLSYNELVGPLPDTLSDLRFLRYLKVDGNNLSGNIPVSFGRFYELEALILSNNLLNGDIPGAIGNITSLKTLHLANNPFTPGPIPPQFGNLFNLEFLWFTNCRLTGTIPESFGRLSQLMNLDVATNRLAGPIPSVIFQLKNVVQMELYENNFTRNLPPTGWSNLTKLRRFDAARNQLTGVIPDELCKLPLESLNLYENHGLEGFIPESIAKSPNLRELKLFQTKLTGPLPKELGKYSPLETIDVTKCNLSGEIPEFLCQNGALEQLILLNNTFSGKLPVQLAKCQSLQRVRLMGNRFYGEIPAEFWGLPHLFLLELTGNLFSGNISHLISSAKNLSELKLSENKFSGNIPSEIGSVDTLVLFAAHHNELGGEIPSTIGNLVHLNELDLSNNELSGGIPDSIQSLKQLNELNLASNGLSGEIPDEIGNLPVLNYLDLSENKFSGRIPQSLQNLQFNVLNLSSNQLSGDIPPRFTRAVYGDSFLGNPGLCFQGFCDSRIRKNDQMVTLILKLIFVTAGLLFLVSLAWFSWKYNKLEKVKRSLTIITEWTSFHKLSFDELEITDSLKEANVIGTGASGKVYKVVLSNGDTVAVKKLLERPDRHQHNFDSTDSDRDEFEVEVDTLGKIRHKNIVKLWCCCNKGNSKLLVYEFMPNGSLGDLLHSANCKLLDWPTRLKIALDSAEGLSYLHHDCVPPIVHRDIKSNNILLDENLGAKISDFGVAKVVKSAARGVEPMSMIAGSCGYIAPEYAYTLRVNEKSDVYSFGVVLLELVTGKPPTDPELGVRDLPTWVCKILGEKGAEYAIDPKLDSRLKEHIVRVLDIGLLCTSSLPINRPSMRRVVKMLQELQSTMVS